MVSRKKRPFFWMVKFLIAAFFLSSSSFAFQQKSSSCYVCHLKSTPKVVKAWENSPHYNKVNCDFCHKGEPQQEKKKKAHQRLKVPNTGERINLCGACHSEQKKVYGFIPSAQSFQLSQGKSFSFFWRYIFR